MGVSRTSVGAFWDALHSAVPIEHEPKKVRPLHARTNRCGRPEGRGGDSASCKQAEYPHAERAADTCWVVVLSGCRNLDVRVHLPEGDCLVTLGGAPRRPGAGSHAAKLYRHCSIFRHFLMGCIAPLSGFPEKPDFF